MRHPTRCSIEKISSRYVSAETRRRYRRRRPVHVELARPAAVCAAVGQAGNRLALAAGGPGSARRTRPGGALRGAQTTFASRSLASRPALLWRAVYRPTVRGRQRCPFGRRRARSRSREEAGPRGTGPRGHEQERAERTGTSPAWLCGCQVVNTCVTKIYDTLADQSAAGSTPYRPLASSA